MNVAIDSLPLTESIFDCRDYSGLQIHLLTHRPLSRLPMVQSGETVRVAVPEDLYWSDGSRLMPRDYLNGIDRALHLNPFVRSFLFRHVKSVRAERDSLLVELNAPNMRLPEVLSLPCFAPDCGRPLSSGDWIRRGTMTFTSSDEVLHVRVVHGPERNLELFVNHDLDISADTAFPYSRLNSLAQNKNLRTHSVGLYCALSFSNSLSRAQRSCVAWRCSEIPFAPVTYDACPKAKPFSYEFAPSHVKMGPLTLAYDNFYPNREICERIAQGLAASGIEVTLVEDDYYNPRVRYDMKLSILRGATDYLLYSSLLPSPALRGERAAYGKLLRGLELQSTMDFTAIRNFIAEHALLVPLFEIPSLYLSRSPRVNPLIEWLVAYMIKKKIILFFLHEFLGSLDFARGLFVLFLVSRGMSMGAVGVLQTLLFWSNLIVEVPAGLLADKFKRKYSIALGLVLIAGAAFMMPYAHSFPWFAVVFLLHGTGFALRSGADKALLYDELTAAGEGNRFLALSSKARSLTNLGLVLAMGAGGFIQGGLGWNFVYGAFGVAMLLAALSVLAIDEGKHSHHAESGEESVNLMASVKLFLTTSTGRSLAFFIFGMGFIEATHAPFFIYIQSYLKDQGIQEVRVSLIIALSLALTSLGYMLTSYLEAIPFARLVRLATVLLCVLIGAFLLHPPVAVGIALFALIDMIPSLLFVHSDTYINHRLPAKIRASLLSVHSLVNSIFISLAFLGGGALLDVYSSATVLGSLALLPLLGIISLTYFFKHREVT